MNRLIVSGQASTSTFNILDGLDFLTSSAPAAAAPVAAVPAHDVLGELFGSAPPAQQRSAAPMDPLAAMFGSPAPAVHVASPVDIWGAAAPAQPQQSK